jgi:hypothetical protein
LHFSSETAMSANLQFLASDNATVITTLNLGSIASPGSSTQTKLYLQNTGTTSADSTTITIEQIGTNDGSIYALLAPDAGGTPGVFGTSPLSVGSIAALGEVPFWTEVTLVAGLSPNNNPRRFNLQGQGLSS